MWTHTYAHARAHTHTITLIKTTPIDNNSFSFRKLVLRLTGTLKLSKHSSNPYNSSNWKIQDDLNHKGINYLIVFYWLIWKTGIFPQGTIHLTETIPRGHWWPQIRGWIRLLRRDNWPPGCQKDDKYRKFFFWPISSQQIFKLSITICASINTVIWSNMKD